MNTYVKSILDGNYKFKLYVNLYCGQQKLARSKNQCKIPDLIRAKKSISFY